MSLDTLPDARLIPQYKFRPLPGHESKPAPPEPKKPDTHGFGRLQRKIDDALSNPVGRKWTVKELWLYIGGRRQRQGYWKALRRMLARQAVSREKQKWPSGDLWFHDPEAHVHGTSRKTRTQDKRLRRRYYAGCRVKEPVEIKSTILRPR